LAILKLGISQNFAARTNQEVEVEPPSIILRWDSLRKQSGIPSLAFAAYVQTVQDTLKLRLTPSSAHVQEVLSLEITSVQKLISAMAALAESIQHEAVQPRKKTGPVTPANIQATLDRCDPHTQNIFKRLIQAWQAAGGVVQATKLGRIYFKLKTRAHQAGTLARAEHRFTLLTLVSPKKGEKAIIQLAWGLADVDKLSAYLDCIPEAVSAYEEAVSALPGFEQKGTVTRLVLDSSFDDDHLDRLVWAVMALKAAESGAI
jgi:hypothetical protein